MDKSTNDRFKIMRSLARLAPSVAAELALRGFATPGRMPGPVRHFSAEAVAFRADGLRIAGYARGEGRVVALLHGWRGRAEQFQSFLEPLARAGFRAVAIDAPAHGASGGRRATIRSFARALEAVARVEGPLTAVIAHSFGAAAATLALASGVKVERAVFLAPATDLGRHLDVYSAALGLDRELFLRLAERRYGVSRREIAIVERARELSVPLLVFHDGSDRAVPLGEVEPLVRNWRGAELRLTSGLGHRRLLADPSVIAQTIAFLARPGEPRQRVLWAAE